MDIKKINEMYVEFYKGTPEKKDKDGNVIEPAKEPLEKVLSEKISMLEEKVNSCKQNISMGKAWKKEPSYRPTFIQRDEDVQQFIEDNQKELNEIKKELEETKKELETKKENIEKGINELLKNPEFKSVLDEQLAKKYDRKIKKMEEKRPQAIENKNLIVYLQKLSQDNMLITNVIDGLIECKLDETYFRNQIKTINKDASKTDVEKANEIEKCKNELKEISEYKRKAIKAIRQAIKKDKNEENKEIKELAGLNVDDKTINQNIEKAVDILSESATIERKDKDGKVIKTEKFDLKTTFNRSVAKINRELKNIDYLTEQNCTAYSEICTRNNKILANPKSQTVKSLNSEIEKLNKPQELVEAESNLEKAEEKLNNLETEMKESSNLDPEEEKEIERKKEKINEKIARTKKEIESKKNEIEKMENKLPAKANNEKVKFFTKIGNFFKGLNRNKKESNIEKSKEELQELEDSLEGYQQELSSLTEPTQTKEEYEVAKEEYQKAQEELIKVQQGIENKEENQANAQEQSNEEWRKRLQVSVMQHIVEKQGNANLKEAKKMMKGKKEEIEPERTSTSEELER